METITTKDHVKSRVKASLLTGADKVPSGLISNFTPSSLIDISSLHYCSYCFTASNAPVHCECEMSECEMSECAPHWPDNWNIAKCLSWNFARCARCQCLADAGSSKDLVQHEMSAHCSAPEDRTDAKEESNISSSSIKHYICYLCKLGSTDLETIKQHYAHTHDMDSLFACITCKRTYFYLHCLQTHWRTNHTGPCPKPIHIQKSDIQFDNSVMTPIDNVGIEAGLKIEDKTFATTEDSTAEINTTDKSGNKSNFDHTIENYNAFLLGKLSNYQINCTFCNYNTPQIDSITSHISLKHYTSISETLINVTEDTTTYRCIVCSTVAKSKGKVALHYVQNHIRGRSHIT